MDMQRELQNDNKLENYIIKSLRKPRNGRYNQQKFLSKFLFTTINMTSNNKVVLSHLYQNKGDILHPRYAKHGEPNISKQRFSRNMTLLSVQASRKSSSQEAYHAEGSDIQMRSFSMASCDTSRQVITKQISQRNVTN